MGFDGNSTHSQALNTKVRLLGSFRASVPQDAEVRLLLPGLPGFFFANWSAIGLELGRVLINRQPNADLDVPPNVRYWG
jgi:hypothetical protein